MAPTMSGSRQQTAPTPEAEPELTKASPGGAESTENIPTGDGGADALHIDPDAGKRMITEFTVGGGIDSDDIAAVADSDGAAFEDSAFADTLAAPEALTTDPAGRMEYVFSAEFT